MEFKQEQFARKLKQFAGQKFTWFALSMATLTITAFNTRPDESGISSSITPQESIPTLTTELVADTPPISQSSDTPSSTFGTIETTEKDTAENDQKKLGSKLVNYAKSLLGLPYNYGGTTKDGFDCSGFVYHIFKKFGIDNIERSSSAQSTQGMEIAVERARPGDLLFFTGTNPEDRTVGHVGIVISEPGEPVSFVHSSSNGGVKISELEGYYDTRFMFAKRVD